jgi:hypothetical protein
MSLKLDLNVRVLAASNVIYAHFVFLTCVHPVGRKRCFEGYLRVMYASCRTEQIDYDFAHALSRCGMQEPFSVITTVPAATGAVPQHTFVGRTGTTTSSSGPSDPLVQTGGSAPGGGGGTRGMQFSQSADFSDQLASGRIPGPSAPGASPRSPHGPRSGTSGIGASSGTSGGVGGPGSPHLAAAPMGLDVTPSVDAPQAPPRAADFDDGAFGSVDVPLSGSGAGLDAPSLMVMPDAASPSPAAPAATRAAVAGAGAFGVTAASTALRDSPVAKGAAPDIVFAPHPGVALDSGRVGDHSTSTLPATPTGPGGSASFTSQTHLTVALDNAARAPTPFLGRYELYDSKHREVTDTAVVQRARGKDDGLEYAIKFFTSRHAYERERSMYADRDLRDALPPVTDIRPNEDGAVTAVDGWVFPPFIVTDRGESLDTWVRNKRDPGFAATVRVLRDVAGQVKGLHGQGLVHRNLNPESINWRPKHKTWALDDFGCADVAGMCTLQSLLEFYSLVYAPFNHSPTSSMWLER